MSRELTQLQCPTLHQVAQAAAAAGARAIANYSLNDLDVRTKSGSNDFVTGADEHSEAAVLDVIRRHRPLDDIVSEECGHLDGSSGVQWSVDPLDGTSNFVALVADYAVSVGCFVAGRPTAGAIHRPADGMAVSSARAPRVDLGAGRLVRRSRLAIGLPYGAWQEAEAWYIAESLEPHYDVLDRTGSAACDLLKLVTGRIDTHIAVGLHEYDVAAGHALVLAAGGSVSRLESAMGQRIWVSGPTTEVEKFGRLLRDTARCRLVHGPTWPTGSSIPA